MTTEQKPEAQEAKEKSTFLIIHTPDRKDVFLEIADSDEAGTYFKGGPLRGFISTTKEGELTGAINLSLGVSNGEGGYNNVDAGVLFRKDGSKGPFLSGYVGGVDVVPGKTEGVEFVNIKPVTADENGKRIGTVSVSADIRGPKAEKILEAMPVVDRPSKKTDEQPEAKRTVKP